MATLLPDVGETFAKRYRLDAVLGEGGHARVYRATDTSLGREVALKLLKPHDTQNAERLAKRFMTEMRTVARLNDPHIVQLFDYGRTDEGAMFVVFELVPGKDLTEVAARGPLSESVTVHITQQLLKALTEAHNNGVLHRDIKPANVRIYRYGDDPHRAKLIDFGISKSLDDDASLTATGHVVGTPRYMAPEQIYGEGMGPGVDLYAVGLVAFEILTGRPSEHMRELANGRVLRFAPEDPGSPEFRTFVERLVARHPKERFASAAEAAAALQKIALEQAAMNPPHDADTIPSRPKPRIEEQVDEDAATKPLAPPRSPAAAPPEEPAPQAGSIRSLIAAVAVVTAVVSAIAWAAAPAPEPTVQPPQPGTRVTGLVRGEKATPTEPVEVAKAETPSDGCGKAPPFIGSGSMNNDKLAGRVTWGVHIPSGYSPSRRHPVLWLFHDDTSSPADIIKDTQLAEIADAEGWVIVAPLDEDFSVWTDEADRRRAREALAAASERLCLDREHVIAIGFGGGGFAADRLSCTPDASALILSSYVLREQKFACSPPRPMPMLFFGPMKTGFQKPKGGTDCNGIHKISYDQFDELWRERNECAKEQTPFAEHGKSQCVSYDCHDAPYVSCRVDGGRPWPGSGPRALDLLNCDGPEPDFPQNEVIRKFVHEHVLSD